MLVVVIGCLADFCETSPNTFLERRGGACSAVPLILTISSAGQFQGQCLTGNRRFDRKSVQSQNRAVPANFCKAIPIGVGPALPFVASSLFALTPPRFPQTRPIASEP